MPNEKKRVQTKVVSSLKSLSAFGHEPVFGIPGEPDVVFRGGIAECKELDAWPKRNGIVKLPHWTIAQKRWHNNWIKNGGLGWVVLKVGRKDWLLFDSITAINYLGCVDKAELFAIAERYWTKGFDHADFRQHIMNAVS